MARVLFCLFLSAISVFPCMAETEEDFVGLLLSEIKANDCVEKLDSSDFSCITIGPAMVEKVMDMMSNNKETDKIKEHIRKILPHVKSLRIFQAQQNIDFYHSNATLLLNKNKKIYKPYNTAGKDSSCSWLRKNKDKVIEIVKLNKTDEDIKVVNFTGDMTDDFVAELLKM